MKEIDAETARFLTRFIATAMEEVESETGEEYDF